MSGEMESDEERVAVLREIADDIRGGSSESRQLATILYRVSDLYDPDEEATPEEAARSVRTILEIKERETLARDRDE